jgi:hypothetical protein
MFYFPHDETRKVDVLVGCFLMIRRRALEQVGYLDEQFFIYVEDIDLCRRFRRSGWEVVFFPRAQAIHYKGASSSNAPIKFSVEQEKSVLQYWAKHHGKAAQLTLFCIIILQHLVRLLAGSFLYLLKPSDRKRLTGRIEENMICLRTLFHSC